MSKRTENEISSNRHSGLSRRSVLGAGAGAAAAVVLPSAALSATRAAVVQTSGDWQPRVLDVRQGRMLSSLVDHLLPRTSTPSATEVGVHEYIDEALSAAEASEQLEFLGGLAWLDRRSSQRFGGPYLEATPAQQVELLEEISDPPPGGDDVAIGAAFFDDLKARTLFGYYTSKPGRQVLGKPGEVRREKLVGCTHGSGSDHRA